MVPPGSMLATPHRAAMRGALARGGDRESSMSTPRRVVIIGSGFGGLAAAVRLAARGHAVTVVEQRDQPGGRAYVYRQDGFQSDGGPTVITAPWLITDLFTLAGRDPDDYVRLVPVDPFYRIFFPDGAQF